VEAMAGTAGRGGAWPELPSAPSPARALRPCGSEPLSSGLVAVPCARTHSCLRLPGQRAAELFCAAPPARGGAGPTRAPAAVGGPGSKVSPGRTFPLGFAFIFRFEIELAFVFLISVDSWTNPYFSLLDLCASKATDTIVRTLGSHSARIGWGFFLFSMI